VRFLSHSNDITEPYGGTHPSLYLSIRALLLLSLTIFFDIGDCLKTKPISKKKVNYTQLHLQIPFKGPVNRRFLQKLSVKISVLTERFLLLSMLFQDWFSLIGSPHPAFLTDHQPNIDEKTRLPRTLTWTKLQWVAPRLRAGPSIHLLTTYAITDPRTEPYLCYQNLLADTGYRKGFSWWVEISSLLLKVKNGVWLLVLVLKQNTGRTRRPQAGIFP